MPFAPSLPQRLLQRSGAALSEGLQALRRWVLLEPKPAVLQGQTCDRLRPRFLELALVHKLAGEQLVDWQWDSRTGQVRGLLWSGRLERFHWLPGLETLIRQPVLSVRRNRSPLQLVQH